MLTHRCSFPRLVALSLLAVSAAFAVNTPSGPVTKDPNTNQIKEDLTFGSGRVLDVSAGTFTLANNQIGWAKVNKTGSSLADLPTRLFSDLQSKPTTYVGYGLPDATNASNLTSGTLAAARLPGLSGDVTAAAGSASVTITNGVVSLGKLGTDVTTVLGGGLDPTKYQGTWTPATNTPTIPTASGNTGNWYFASAAGTATGNAAGTYASGDRITSNGTNWLKMPAPPTVILDGAIAESKLDTAAAAKLNQFYPTNRFLDSFWTVFSDTTSTYRGRVRWIGVGGTASFVVGDTSNPCPGKTLRVVLNANYFGQKLWLDELLLKPANTYYVSALVKAPAGASFAFQARAENSSVLVYSQTAANFVGTGATQAVSIKISPTTLSATGDGSYTDLWSYFYSATSATIDVYALAVSAAPITSLSAADWEPGSVNFYLPTDLAANAAAISVETDSRRGINNIAFSTAYGVGWTALTARSTASTPTAGPRALPFVGWGAKYNKLGATWNAVRLRTVSRTPTIVTSEQWTTCHVVVRATSGGGDDGLGAVIATGSIPVNPAADTLNDVVVLLRDPSSSIYKTLSDTDLSAPYFVGYYFTNSTGGGAAAGEAKATSISNWEGDSFYIMPTNVASQTWTNYTQDGIIAIEHLLLTNPVEDYVPTAINPAMIPVPTPPAILLPDFLYSVVGRESNVYFNSVMERPGNYLLDVACSAGQQQNERWTDTPSTSGSTTLSIVAYELATAVPLGSAVSSTLLTAAANAGGGVTRKCLFIGDSTTNAGQYTAELVNLSTVDSNLHVTLLGTQGSGANRHEGQGGYTVDRYYAPGATYYAGNPFVNPAQSPTGNFDFSYYLGATSQTMASGDWVFFHLGINDIYNLTTDDAVSAKADAALAQLETMITSVKSAVSGVNIGMMVTIPPSEEQDAFGNNSAAGVVQWRYKRNWRIWCARFIANFRGRTGSAIYLVPVHTAVDTVNNMSRATAANVNSRSTVQVQRQSNAVHPATAGYNQMADAIWAFAKNRF